MKFKKRYQQNPAQAPTRPPGVSNPTQPPAERSQGPNNAAAGLSTDGEALAAMPEQADNLGQLYVECLIAAAIEDNPDKAKRLLAEHLPVFLAASQRAQEEQLKELDSLAGRIQHTSGVLGTSIAAACKEAITRARKNTIRNS